MCTSPTSVVVLFAMILARSNGQVENKSLAFAGKISDTVSPGFWISDLFYQAFANFTVRNVGNNDCQRQSEMYDKHLRNHTDWAVRMAESWNRRPIGILAGNSYHLGIYDECVEVAYPINGQYCLPEVKLILAEGKNIDYGRDENLDNFSTNNAWQTILEWVNYPDQIQRNVLNLGICIPDACSALDLQTTLQIALDKVFLPHRVKAVVKVDPIMCTVKKDKYPYNTGYYVTSAFFVLLVLICLVATICQYFTLTREKNKTEDLSDNIYNSILNSFSFIESSKSLFKYDKNNELNILNGFKVTTMVSILFGHKYMYLAGSPMSYTKPAEQIYLNGPAILLTSMNFVDPFFFISGFLMYTTVTPEFQKSRPGWIKFASPIIYRMMRMLPAYCAIMAITAHIVPHLGDGPFWPKKTWDEAEKCKHYWWTNVLFISNLIGVKYQCLIASWYVACDVQFFIAGVVIFYVYTKNSKYGMVLLGSVISISLVIPIIVTILTNGDGILKIHFPFLENPRNSIIFDEMYRKNYMRATPFFTGLAFGIIVAKLKEKKFKFRQTTVFGGTFITVAICLWVQFYGTIFYNRQRPYYLIERALYSTLSHCTWTVISAWISICHFTSGYGAVSKLLTNKFIVILGRLSFSVFLVNLTVMMMSQSSQRLSFYLSIKSVLDAWIYDTFNSYLTAFMLYMIVEAPFGKLFKLLLRGG